VVTAADYLMVLAIASEIVLLISHMKLTVLLFTVLGTPCLLMLKLIGSM